MMNLNKEHKIGILMLLSFIAIFITVAGFDFLLVAAYLAGLGVLAIFLYSFKAKGPKSFYLLKVPLNIICNAFLLVLLLKSWTMRGFKKDLEQLEEQTGKERAT
jgi:hypothetical protein